MPNETLKPALRAALRFHEIGSGSPYKLYFAAKGKSGGSFGFMQGDLAAKQPVVTKAFRDIMAAEGFPAEKVNAWVKALSVHVVGNPLTPADATAVNAALLKHSAMVDAMDENILAKVYTGLDKAIAAAASAHRTVSPEAALMIAMWINMSGPPTKILTWLSGNTPLLAAHVDPPGNPVSQHDMTAYLRATDYYTNNPGNFPHLLAALAAGMAAYHPH
jgi:hypothetical protein